jgi:hypothetical protein
MPVAASDRPLDAVRRETIDQLILNYAHGALSREAFERRLDTAMDAQSHEALLALTEDLDELRDPQYAQKKQEEFGLLGADDVEEEEWMVHIFSGSKRTNTWNVPASIKMINVFGGGELDFTHARFATRKTRVTIFCLFGGATFYVPEGVNTISKAICIFGGVDNSAPSSHDPNAPTLVIDGFALFGGAAIKLRRSFKKRAMEFAESVRSMFGPR